MSIAGEKVHPAGLPTGWASTDCVPPTPRSTDTELPHADVICDVQRALNSANTVRMPKITRDHYTAVRRNRTLWSVGLPATAPGLHWLEKRKSPLSGAVGFDIKRGEAITSRYQRGACGLRRFPPRPWRRQSSNRPAGLPCPAPEPCTARRSA